MVGTAAAPPPGLHLPFPARSAASRFLQLQQRTRTKESQLCSRGMMQMRKTVGQGIYCYLDTSLLYLLLATTGTTTEWNGLRRAPRFHPPPNLPRTPPRNRAQQFTPRFSSQRCRRRRRLCRGRRAHRRPPPRPPPRLPPSGWGLRRRPCRLLRRPGLSPRLRPWAVDGGGKWFKLLPTQTLRLSCR